MKKICYLFVIVTVIASCKKKEEETPPASGNNKTTTTITIESAPQISVKIDGSNFSKIEDGTTVAEGYGTSKSLRTPPDSSTATFTSYIANHNYTETFFQVKSDTMTFMGYKPSNADFKAFFKTGSYSFSGASIVDITLMFVDDAGTVWSTDMGDQTSSSFVITDIKEQTVAGDYEVKIKAIFNCKMYDGTGGVKTFTDGIYIGSFGNI